MPIARRQHGVGGEGDRCDHGHPAALESEREQHGAEHPSTTIAQIAGSAARQAVRRSRQRAETATQANDRPAAKASSTADQVPVSRRARRRDRPAARTSPAATTASRRPACRRRAAPRRPPAAPAHPVMHTGDPGRPAQRAPAERDDHRGDADTCRDDGLDQEQRQQLQRDHREDETRAGRPSGRRSRWVGAAADRDHRSFAARRRPPHAERFDRRPDPGTQRRQDREREAEHHLGSLTSVRWARKSAGHVRCRGRNVLVFSLRDGRSGARTAARRRPAAGRSRSAS